MTYPGLMPWRMRDLTEREWRAICDDHDRRVTDEEAGYGA